jgi:hypothetical protein
LKDENLHIVQELVRNKICDLYSREREHIHHKYRKESDEEQRKMTVLLDFIFTKDRMIWKLGGRFNISQMLDQGQSESTSLSSNDHQENTKVGF